ncbi:sensor histidine kinase [Robbsia andropogonis]|uniref:sensor histidine kinase n=1 Tax=Robbsia andropogonis TaxID=28092 RepID=UPI00209FF92E|nr:sensor histidine kinase [Robbsia andropogonis]MCP1118467.1 sensor histidine kinase N-terminal domain-containing protein [Robbsia andropogonis]MCP1127753.1 sensor histidine kinase N-terminal domain-containing protein [Robbsia andropogonis]
MSHQGPGTMRHAADTGATPAETAPTPAWTNAPAPSEQDPFPSTPPAAARNARSLLAEILDWMLAPLLMLWPLSIAVTWLIAKSIAGAPFDHALERRLAVLARQVHQAGPVALAPLPAIDADWLLDDPDDTALFQVRDTEGRVLAGSPQLPDPQLSRPAPAGSPVGGSMEGMANADDEALVDANATGTGAMPGVVRMRDVVAGGRAMRLAWTSAIAPDTATATAPPSGHAVARALAADDVLTLPRTSAATGTPERLVAPPDVAGVASHARTRILVIQVAETLNKRNALANDVIKGVILPQLIILPIVILLVWFGLTRGLAPLHVLQTRIRKRDPDDRSPLMPGDAPTELAPLLSSFNELLGRLDANTTAQKRFIAQAAHQMKTPLAGLRMQAEIALRHPVPPDVRRSLEQIATSSRQAARLVTQLLALARAEEAAPLRTAVTLDAATLCREVVRDWAQAAIDKSIDLGYEGPSSGVSIVGQPLLLREMVANLIDNAVRYTQTGGRVTVRLHDQDPILIEVEDNGPGIPAAERPHVVERFYRILGRDGDGSGLGLAIVQEIVAMHDGTLTIGDHVYQTVPHRAGTLIHVTLPRTASATEDTDLPQDAATFY